MKGVTVAGAGAEWKVVDDLEKPTPGKGQVLVKSLFSGINPVETLMQSYGVMVVSWPIVLGCDASGEVVEVGEGVTKFKVGDGIFGCTRLGMKGYGTFQEFHLMDEALAFKRPDNVTAEQAATLGVGILTASLGLIPGLGLTLPDKEDTAAHDDKWVIVLSGSGSIGQYAIQIATLAGYHVLASTSSAKAGICTTAGAIATFDYKLPLSDQLKQIDAIIGGKFSKVMDAGAVSYAAALEILTKGSTEKDAKRFSSTDDWSEMSAEGIEIYRIKLGSIGRFGEGEEQEEINKVLIGVVPTLERLVAEGKIKPMEYEVLGTGFGAVSDAIKAFDSGKAGGKKAIVKIAED